MRKAGFRHSDGRFAYVFLISCTYSVGPAPKPDCMKYVDNGLTLGDLLSDFPCLILDGIHLSIFPDIFPSLQWLRSQPQSSWSSQALRNKSLLFISHSPWKDLKCSFNILDHMNLYEKSKVCPNEESA